MVSNILNGTVDIVGDVLEGQRQFDLRNARMEVARLRGELRGLEEGMQKRIDRLNASEVARVAQVDALFFLAEEAVGTIRKLGGPIPKAADLLEDSGQKRPDGRAKAKVRILYEKVFTDECRKKGVDPNL